MNATVAGARPPWLQRPEVLFPVRFAVLALVMAAGWAALTPHWPTLTAWTSEIVAWSARLCGLDGAAEPGSQVVFSDGGESFRYTIVESCTAVTLLMIFTAAVLAYPTSARRRMAGLAIGLPFLFVANLVRLVGLAWVGLHAPARFEALHQYWGQAVLITLAGVCWFAWVWFVAGERRHASASAGQATADTRSTRVRRAAAPVGAFCAVFVIFGVLGFAAHGVTGWAALIRQPLYHVAPAFGEVLLPLSELDVLSAYGIHYASLAAIVALFLLTPRISWRDRLIAALLIGLPLAYLIQVAIGIVNLAAVKALHSTAVTPGAPGAGGLTGSLVNSLTLAAHVAIPALLWHRWARHGFRPFA